MRKFRGFKLGRPFIRFSKWVIRRTRKHPYKSLDNRHTFSPWKTKLLNWGRCLSTKSLYSMKQSVPCKSKGYVALGQEVHSSKSVPKGHLAVYISCNDGVERVLVPVIYFNHPLFGELLREAESEFGFAQQGGITIPCRFSEFESVKTRIDAAVGRRVVGCLRRC